MSESKTIVWCRELGDWEIGEVRLSSQPHRQVAYALHHPTGDNYYFFAGFGGEPEAITEEMLIVVTNYIADRDCTVCLSNSLANVYQKIGNE